MVKHIVTLALFVNMARYAPNAMDPGIMPPDDLRNHIPIK